MLTLYLRDVVIIACYIPCLFLIATTIWVRTHGSVAWAKTAGWQLTLLHSGILMTLSLTVIAVYLALNPTETFTVLSRSPINTAFKLVMLGEWLAVLASVLLFYVKNERTDGKAFQVIVTAASAAFLLIPLLVLRTH